MASSGSRLAAAVLGAGLAVWLAASCGPTEVICGPGTCDGCCEGNACLPAGSQAFTRCGKAGAACSACLPGQLCLNGGCALDPNRPAIITPEPPRKDSGTSACGQITQPCCQGTCAGGLQCNGTVCVAPDAGSPDSGTPDAGPPDAGPSLKALGEPCQAGTECAAGQCAQGTAFLNGYCTRACAVSADCGAGGTCGLDPRDPLGNARMCFKGCAPAGTAGGCRTGYVCEGRVMEDGRGGCYPSCAQLAGCPGAATCDGRGFCCGPLGFACCNGTTCQGTATCGASLYCQAGPPPDSGTPPAPTGSACAQGSQCQGASCIPEEQAGTPSCPTAPCWPQGYCTQTCGATAPCAPGSTCSVLTSNGRNLCLDNCAFDGGQGDCRTGYVCDRYWGLNGIDQATCFHACATGQDCPGRTDCNNGFCCGDVLYACCAGGTCPFGGVCGADGYCH